MGIAEHVQTIAARVRGGGTPAEVKREIIDPASLTENQRNALGLYAATLARQVEREDAINGHR
jgi:hypothetical protein